MVRKVAIAMVIGAWVVGAGCISVTKTETTAAESVDAPALVAEPSPGFVVIRGAFDGTVIAEAGSDVRLALPVDAAAPSRSPNDEGLRDQLEARYRMPVLDAPVEIDPKMVVTPDDPEQYSMPVFIPESGISSGVGIDLGVNGPNRVLRNEEPGALRIEPIDPEP